MNHQEGGIVLGMNPAGASVAVALAVLHAMSGSDHVPHVYTIVDPYRDRRTRVPVRLPPASDCLPRALSPSAQKIVDDARARKVANKLKTAALCRNVQS